MKCTDHLSVLFPGWQDLIADGEWGLGVDGGAGELAGTVDLSVPPPCHYAPFAG